MFVCFLFIFSSDKGGGKCFCPRLFVRFCLYVCLLARLLKTCAWIWMKCCVSTKVGSWTNWLTFEPNPDYSPDAGTGLLSPIPYALQRGILLRQENLTYRYWTPVAAATRGFIHREPCMGTPLSTECPSSNQWEHLCLLSALLVTSGNTFVYWVPF